MGNEKVPGQVLYILKILMEIMEVEVVGRLQGRGTEENQLWKSLNANICNNGEMELFQVLFKVQNSQLWIIASVFCDRQLIRVISTFKYLLSAYKCRAQS